MSRKAGALGSARVSSGHCGNNKPDEFFVTVQETLPCPLQGNVRGEVASPNYMEQGQNLQLRKSVGNRILIAAQLQQRCLQFLGRWFLQLNTNWFGSADGSRLPCANPESIRRFKPTAPHSREAAQVAKRSYMNMQLANQGQSEIAQCHSSH